VASDEFMSVYLYRSTLICGIASVEVPVLVADVPTITLNEVVVATLCTTKVPVKSLAGIPFTSDITPGFRGNELICTVSPVPRPWSELVVHVTVVEAFVVASTPA
jgi:hypothetical protein